MKAAIVITLVCLVCYTTSQSYHFSNGWNPGKRSSSQCSFSPYVKSMISKLLEVRYLYGFLLKKGHIKRGMSHMPRKKTKTMVGVLLRIHVIRKKIANIEKFST